MNSSENPAPPKMDWAPPRDVPVGFNQDNVINCLSNEFIWNIQSVDYLPVLPKIKDWLRLMTQIRNVA